MTEALVMTLPALLCAVFAWDLSRPARGGAAITSPHARAVGALLGSCGAAVLVGAWLPRGGPTPLLAGAAVGVGIGAAVLATASRRRSAGAAGANDQLTNAPWDDT